jgi:hypothetical protein
MTITCVGIDFDTHCVHLVRLPTVGLPTYHPVPLEGDDSFERMRRVAWEMPGEGFWQDVIAVGIEEPAGQYVVGKLKGIQGAVISTLPLDVLIAPYRPALWRKLALQRGDATKAEVRAWVYERLGENPGWPQDACDAYCLAYVVSQQVVTELAT